MPVSQPDGPLLKYDNNITSLRGMGTLRQLTHLYAQQNELESLDDFDAPPSLEHLLLQGNKIRLIRGLDRTTRLTALDVSRTNALHSIRKAFPRRQQMATRKPMPKRAPRRRPS